MAFFLRSLRSLFRQWEARLNFHKSTPFSCILPKCKCNPTDIEDDVDIAYELRPWDACEGLMGKKLDVLAMAMDSES